MTRNLLDFLFQQALYHRSWPYQVSGLEILRSFIKLRLSKIGPCLFTQFIESVLDLSQNAPYAMVKATALETLEVICLVFPKAIAGKLADLRENVR